MDTVLTEDTAIPLLGIYPENATTYNKDTFSTMFIAALFKMSQAENNLDVLQQRNEYRKYGIFT